MAIYSELRVDEVQRLARQYGLSVDVVERMDGGHCNSNYLLRSGRRRSVMTVFDERSMAEANSLGRLLSYLVQSNFPTSRPLSLASGGFVAAYESKPVMVRQYVDGQVCLEMDRAMLRQVGASLARLHRLPVPSFGLAKSPCGFRTIKDVTGRLIDLDFESWLGQQIKMFQQEMPAGLPVGVVHADLFDDNVLLAKGRLKAFIDFEDACLYYLVFDIGMAILGTCRRGPELALKKARHLLAGYQTVRKLQAVELESLQLFVGLAATLTAGWRFWKYHIQHPSPELANEHRKMAEIADSMRTMASSRFLRDISP